jgi:hypothetical protein
VTVQINTHDGTMDTNPHGYEYPAADSSYPTTEYDAGVCKNAVSKVHYTVEHNGNGRILSVEVGLWYTDITESFTEQEFSVQYVGPATTSDWPAATRLQRSGMPGYLPGSEVLSGRVQQHTRDNGHEVMAIEERQGGMAVVGMGQGGWCLGGQKPVQFMHDVVVACNVALDKSELQTACEEQGEDGGGVTTMYTPLLNGTDDHVGLFGDSNQYVMAEWIPIQQDGTVAPGDWNSDTGVCTNLVTRMHLTLYTAAVGNVLEPQNKIVGAYRSYGTETVGHSGSDNLKQRMELRTVVTFVELPNRVLEEQVLATPRIIPKMPADFFYPFKLSTSGAGSAKPLLVTLVTLMGVVAATMS